MIAPNPTPPSQHRNKIAQPERDNRDSSRKIAALSGIINGPSHSVDVTNEQLIAL